MSDMSVGRMLIALGIFLVVLGLLLTIGERLPLRLGRLPGDIYARGKHISFYFPVVDVYKRQGQTGLSVAFDLPTLMGYDADHGLAEGEVGKCGASVSSLEDMEILFRGIPLGDVTVSMTINSVSYTHL